MGQFGIDGDHDMSKQNRLEKLERALAGSEGCPRCKGSTARVILPPKDGTDPEEQRIAACPDCGRELVIVRVRLVEPEKRGET